MDGGGTGGRRGLRQTKSTAPRPPPGLHSRADSVFRRRWRGRGGSRRRSCGRPGEPPLERRAPAEACRTPAASTPHYSHRPAKWLPTTCILAGLHDGPQRATAACPARPALSCQGSTRTHAHALSPSQTTPPLSHLHTRIHEHTHSHTLTHLHNSTYTPSHALALALTHATQASTPKRN